jgi:opacity protein-like surface antigen
VRKIIAFAAALAFSGQALAADLYQPEQPVEQAPVAEPVVAANGWYLRGDVSYDIMKLRGTEYFEGGAASNLVSYDSAKVNNTGNIGLGVGYQVTDYFRVDKTFDYMFKTNFRGMKDCGPCVSHDVSSLTAFSLMANAYVDITKMGMFTPYLGAGIGGTYVKWDDFHGKTVCTDDTCEGDSKSFYKGRANWRFTYAVMAGTSVDINCKVKADVGYRYRHVSGGKMFGYNNNGGPAADKGFDIHEVRTGLRYSFGDCGEQAYLPPVDLPSQPQPVFK